MIYIKKLISLIIIKLTSIIFYILINLSLYNMKKDRSFSTQILLIICIILNNYVTITDFTQFLRDIFVEYIYSTNFNMQEYVKFHSTLILYPDIDPLQLIIDILKDR